MKKEKAVISTLVGISIFSFSFSAFAESPNGNVKKGSQSLEPIIQISKSKGEDQQPKFLKPNRALKQRQMTEGELKRGYKANEVIVKFKQDKSIASLGAAGRVKGLKEFKNLDRKLGIKTLKFDTNVASVNEIVRFLNASDDVEYAEPNYIYKPSAVSDPMYNNLWGLKNSGQTIDGVPGKAGMDIKAEGAWTKTKGSTSTVIAVIDTGTDISHPDLKDNIWKNSGEVPNDGVDNDNNGYVDDVNGWNFFDKNNDVYYDAYEDAHGTHVSGTIAGRANTTGVIGVAPNVKIMPLKFIGPFGGSLDDAILAVNYAKSKGVKISNNSWGGGGFSQALYDVIKNSNSLFVAAAGNDGVNADSTPMYPAAFNLTNILSVAALNNTGNLASFSNYGATSVDIAAPGEQILSTTPENNYEYFDGTSMASPHATGAAALVTAAYPSDTPLQIKDKLMKSVTKLSSLTGKVSTGGLLNAQTAVASTDIDGDIPGVPFTGTSKSSTLNTTSDKDDVYSIKLLKGEKLSVTLSGATGTDFDLYLYDKTATTVNSSQKIVAYSEKANTSNESFTFVAPSDGTYYLDVYAYKGIGSYTANVKYGVTAGTYEDVNSDVSFNGNWQKVSTNSASGGSYKWVNESSASTQLVFNGTGISYTAFKDSTQGIAKVTLDGVSYAVDLFASSPQYKATVFSKTGLTAGRHVLKIEWTGKIHTGAKKTATKINVDSFIVK